MHLASPLINWASTDQSDRAGSIGSANISPLSVPSQQKLVNSLATDRDNLATGQDSLATGQDSLKYGYNSLMADRDSLATGRGSLKAGVEPPTPHFSIRSIHPPSSAINQSSRWIDRLADLLDWHWFDQLLCTLWYIILALYGCNLVLSVWSYM